MNLVQEVSWEDIYRNEGTDIQALSFNEIDEVSGGFICGGLCIAGAFVLGAAIGGGLAYWALS